MDRKNNILKILTVILCLGGVTIFAMYESGMNIPFIQSYKNNFKKNISGFSNLLGIELPIEVQLYLDDMSTPTPKPTMMPAEEQENFADAVGYPSYEEDVEAKEGTAALTTKSPVKPPANAEILPIALDKAENSRFLIYKGNILCANETEFSSYSRSGKELFKHKLQMQSPALSASGNYILINEIGARKIRLYKDRKLLFATETDGNIVSARVSEDGDVVAVTQKEYFKGQVVVINKSGKVIFAWDSGSYDILDAAISKKRQVAVSLLNTDSGADSFVTCFGVDGSTKYKTDVFKDCIIFDLEYSGEKLTALADNKCAGITSRGKIAWEHDFSDKHLTYYTIAPNGFEMLLFDTGSAGEAVTVTPGGRKYGPVKTESLPLTADIKSGNIAYNNGRDIILTDFKGKKILKASCDSDIKQVHIIDSSHVLAVYSSSIQVKKPAKPAKSETAEVPEQPAENGADNG